MYNVIQVDLLSCSEISMPVFYWDALAEICGKEVNIMVIYCHVGVVLCMEYICAPPLPLDKVIIEYSYSAISLYLTIYYLLSQF